MSTFSCSRRRIETLITHKNLGKITYTEAIKRITENTLMRMFNVYLIMLTLFPDKKAITIGQRWGRST